MEAYLHLTGRRRALLTKGSLFGSVEGLVLLVDEFFKVFNLTNLHNNINSASFIPNN